MSLRLGQPADHGFDQPLGLLSDCHRRIEQFLGIIVTVVRVARGGPLTGQNRMMLSAAHDYFASAGPRHTADEEVSLFPRLQRVSGGVAEALRETLHTLEADHRRAEGLHADVEALLGEWLNAGALPPAAEVTLNETLDALSALYGRHIAIEDGTLFPAAAEMLSPALLEEIGREMAARRNVPYLPPPDLATVRHR